MRKDAVFTIAEVDYHTQQLSAAEAFDLLRFGDCLSTFVQAAQANSNITRLISAIAEMPDYEEFLRRVFKHIQVAGEASPIDVDSYFGGRYELIPVLLTHFIELNYLEFMSFLARHSPAPAEPPKPQIDPWTGKPVEAPPVSQAPIFESKYDRERLQVQKKCSVDIYMYQILTSKPVLADLHQLQTVYSLDDAVTFLEILATHSAFQDIAFREQEEAHAKANQ